MKFLYLNIILLFCFLGNIFSQNVTYHILLLNQKSKSKYFDKYYNGSQNVRSYRTKDGFVFIAGSFKTMQEAEENLRTIREMGLSNIRIIDSNELIKLLGGDSSKDITFTIHLGTFKTKQNLTNFEYIQKDNITEIIDNGNFIYIYKRFFNFLIAKEEWLRILKSGYENAFIMNINRYNLNND